MTISRTCHRWGAAVVLATVVFGPAAAVAQECQLYVEGFASFGGPADFDNGTYRVEWCEAGAQTTTSEFCSGNALRMTSSSQDPIIWLYVGDMGCTSATLQFDFGSFATTGTALKYSVTSDATLNCAEAIAQYAGSIDYSDGVCHTAEHTVELSSSDRSVYWKFDHGLPSSNAFYLDNVYVFLAGCDCDAAPVAHDCCTTGAAGCTDATVQACVCASDAFCCSTEWDAQCVAEVNSFGCGTCGSGGACATAFDADFGTYFQSGTVCSRFPALFPTCAGTGPYLTSGTGCGGTGDYTMGFASGYPYSAATTRCLDLALSESASLLFSYAKSSGLGPRIEISINGGSTFSTLWTAPFGAATGCVSDCLDLAAYLGQSNVRLRFSSGSSTANGASFDDIHLVLGSGCPTCVDPTADAGANRSICPGGTAVLTGAAAGGDGGSCPGAQAIQWEGPGIVSGGQTLSPTVDAAGQYIMFASCDACAAYDLVQVSVAADRPTVDAGPVASLACAGGAVQLGGSVSGCPGATSVVWTATNGGVIVSGAETLTPTVSAAGAYTLTATCSGGCSASDSVPVLARVAGDWDGDGSVDLTDFAVFVDCLTGPGVAVASNCLCGDFDTDTDVDLGDYAGQQDAFGTTTTFVGACCGADGLCTEMGASDCLAAGGTYHGHGDACASVICPFGAYHNEASPITSYFGNGAALADDLSLAGVGARELIGYDLAVYGGAGGAGAFDVTTKLYTDCPGHGGTEIVGAGAISTSVPDDGYVYVLTVDLSSAPVTIPDTVWMVVSFSTSLAGWVGAGEAEVGYTGNFFGTNETSSWACANAFTGESAPHAGFWANLECVSGSTSPRPAGDPPPSEPRTAITRLAQPSALSAPGSVAR